MTQEVSHILCAHGRHAIRIAASRVATVISSATSSKLAHSNFHQEAR